MPDIPHTVFVSHAHADNALCDRYVAALRSRGLNVWYDRTNMQDGDILSDQIAEELERRTAFVVLLTPASVESFWMKLETRTYLNLLAQDPSRMLLPVRIAECKVPVLLQTLKYIDAVALGFDAAVDALTTALRATGDTHADTSSAHLLVSDEVASLISQGDALRREGELSRAIEVYGRALKLDRDNMAVLLRQMDTFNLLGSTLEGYLKGALVCSERLLELDPSNAQAWVGKG